MIANNRFYRGMQGRYYCIKCEKPNNCKCGTDSHRFAVSYKLRVPLTTNNKVIFRKFLDDCPQFPNCVPEHLQEDFRALLRKIKYFNKVINGHQWTLITK